MLYVTKTYLPPKQRFLAYMDQLWDSHVLTNNGSLVLQLEERLQAYSNSPRVLACTNGTVVLQMALRAMGITRQVITTPFSYVATTNALLWEHCEPVFVDVNPADLTIDPDLIEAAITPHTQAILATHVYGYPCAVDQIQEIATRYGLKVIYDAANAFGTSYKGKSIFTYGDISTCSFHATKLFHSGEGGALFINDPGLYEQLFLYRSFGHIHDNYYSIGINAKMSDLHAAMGLCVLDDIQEIIAQRKLASSIYDESLDSRFRFMQQIPAHTEYNYAYYPVLLQDADAVAAAMTALAEKQIFPRRYFYPSLNQLPFLEKKYACPVSEDAAARVLCLPLSHYITSEEIKQISSILNKIK